MIRKVEFMNTKGDGTKLSENEFAFMYVYFNDSKKVLTKQVFIKDIKRIDGSNVLVKYKDLSDKQIYQQVAHQPLVKNIKKNRKINLKSKKVLIPTALVLGLSTTIFFVSNFSNGEDPINEDSVIEEDLEQELGDEQMSSITLDDEFSIVDSSNEFLGNLNAKGIENISISDVLATSYILNINSIDEEKHQNLIESTELPLSVNDFINSFSYLLRVVNDYNISSNDIGDYISLRPLVEDGFYKELIENHDLNYQKLKFTSDNLEAESIIRDYGKFLSGEQDSSYGVSYDEISIGLRHLFSIQAAEKMIAARGKGVYDHNVAEPIDTTDLLRERLEMKGFESISK